MRNPILPLAALLLGLAVPALAQQASTDDAAARTLAQNARVSVYQAMTAEAARVPDAAPSVAVTYPRNPPARRLAIASNQTR